MVRSLTVAVACVSLTSSAEVAQAQDAKSAVLELFFQSCAYPEGFSPAVATSLLGAGTQQGRALSCLAAIRDSSFQLSQAIREQCRVHEGDANAYWECLKNDPAGSLWLWAGGALQLLRGEVREWSETQSGRSMIAAKRLLEQMQPGMWVGAVQAGLPLMRKWISCGPEAATRENLVVAGTHVSCNVAVRSRLQVPDGLSDSPAAVVGILTVAVVTGVLWQSALESGEANAVYECTFDTEDRYVRFVLLTGMGPCRRYQRTSTALGTATAGGGTACRDSAGVWRDTE